ncbi:MAG: ABC transporter permease [Flavobacteriales bacterium]
MFSLFKENIHIAFHSIKSQLLRTILTIVIIGIGIWALVGILSAVKGLENTISSNFASMGSNTFTLQQYNFTVQRHGRERKKINPVISYQNIREFVELYEFPNTQTSVSFIGTRNAEIRFEKEKTDPDIPIYGVNQFYLDNTGTKIDRGRNFTIFDIQNNTKACILGSDFEKGIFKNTNPIGKTISIRGVKFKVIGIMESKGSTFGNNQDLKVLIPIQVARGIYTQPNINYTISIKVDRTEMMDAAQDEAIITFRNIRKLNPLEKNNFGMERSDDLINKVATISGYLEAAAWIISIITLLGSSIALMNIMLVSVTERTREIGVRKALGAKNKAIATQFFIETIVIGQFGSILGIILGVLTGLLIANLLNFDFSIPWFPMLAATIITFIIAIIAGFYPATKASKLDPIESLRYE